jgi:hypothetical protein
MTLRNCYSCGAEVDTQENPECLCVLGHKGKPLCWPCIDRNGLAVEVSPECAYFGAMI